MVEGPDPVGGRAGASGPSTDPSAVPAGLMDPDGAAPERVAVLRALQLGDLLCAVPALRALRAALPKSIITLIGLPWAASFGARFHHLLDDVLALPGFPGLPEQHSDPASVLSFLQDAQARRFDLVLQMHGSGITSNPLAALLGGRAVAGYYLPGQFCPDPRRFLPYPTHEPEIRRHLRLVEFLGVPLRGEHLEFPVEARDRAEAASIRELDGMAPGTYACVHPGARDPARRWAREGFVSVARHLQERGFTVILTGTEDEADLVSWVAARAQGAIDLAGRTGLGALAALVERARVVVANDTGVAHVAEALRVPSVVVFTSSDLERWAPLDRDRHRVVRASVRKGGVGPDATPVIEEVDRVLAGEPARRL